MKVCHDYGTPPVLLDASSVPCIQLYYSIFHIMAFISLPPQSILFWRSYDTLILQWNAQCIVGVEGFIQQIRYETIACTFHWAIKLNLQNSVYSMFLYKDIGGENFKCFLENTKWLGQHIQATLMYLLSIFTRSFS